MLHIVLLILKIMGILLLSVLGIILILFFIILLNPAAYQISLSGKNTIDSIKLNIKFHWLYHLLSGFLIFENGKLFWKFRAAWKSFSSDVADEHLNHFNSAEKDTSAQQSSPEKIKLPDEDPKPLSTYTGTGEQHYSEKSANKQQKVEKVSGIFKIKKKIVRLYNKIRSIPTKMKYTIETFCDKIKSLIAKKDKIICFLENDVHKKAFRRFAKELKRFLKLMKPSKSFIEFHFGFDDPAYTGYLLAALSLLYPCLGGHAQFNADFEHKILCGNLFIKGRFRVIYALIFILGLLIDKNVRQTYRHVRKFKI